MRACPTFTAPSHHPCTAHKASEGDSGLRSMETLPRAAGALLRARGWPTAARAGTAGLILALAGLSFLAPRSSELSPLAAATWILWWGLVPFLAFVAGKAWCSVCPIGWVAESAESWWRPRRHLPPALTSKLSLLGVAGGGILFLAAGLEASAPLTLGVLLFGTAAALGMGALFRRRPFCRVCPVGNLLSLYAATSRLGISVVGKPAGQNRETDGGASLARKAVLACPQGLNPTRDPALSCTFCGDCLKRLPELGVRVREGGPALPPRGVGLSAVRPGRERSSTAQAGWNRRLRRDLAGLVLGLLAADALRMTPVFPLALAPAAGFIPYQLAAAVWAGGFASLGLLAARWVEGRGGNMETTVPLLLAAQVGLSLQHLAGAGGSAIRAVLSPFLGGQGHIPPASVYSWDPVLKAVQVSLLSLAMASVWLPGPRLQRPPLEDPRGSPQALLLWAPAGVFLALTPAFLLPMSRAC